MKLTIAFLILITPLTAAEFRVETFSSRMLGISPESSVAYQWPAGFERLSEFSFAMANRSEKSIIGMQVIWSVTDSRGQVRQIHSQCDDVLGEGRALAAGKETLLLAPGVFLPESLARSKAPIFQPSLTSGLQWVEDARKVTVSIDAVLFEDGELVGPDTLRYAEDLRAKVAAAHALTETNVPELARSTPDQDDFEAMWKRRLASMVMRSSDRGATIQGLHARSLPAIYQTIER